MLTALERGIASTSERIVLLAPALEAVSNGFQKVECDPDKHRQMLEDVQRLRGSVYLKDGAIREDQLSDRGRHIGPEDDKSWHFLLLDHEQHVDACMLYFEHKPDVRFEDTRAAVNPLMGQREWRQVLWRAVESELRIARRNRLKYVELGGWAASEKSRGTCGPLALVLAAWAFSRRSGGALGLTTATFRHCSAMILKRMGGSRFEVDGHALPSYFDPRYGCTMELLRFDSRQPHPKYASLIDQVTARLSAIRVITRPSALESLKGTPRTAGLAGSQSAVRALAS